MSCATLSAICLRIPIDPERKSLICPSVNPIYLLLLMDLCMSIFIPSISVSAKRRKKRLMRGRMPRVERAIITKIGGIFHTRTRKEVKLCVLDVFVGVEVAVFAFVVAAVAVLGCSLMRCLKPIGIIDKTTKLARMVPCGQCVACRINYALDWAYRCHVESLHYSDDCMCFLTLTYDDQNCVGTLSKRHLQLFFKRLRKHGLKLRYLACGEYGPSTMRPHYHMILFGVGQDSDIWLDKHYSAKLHGYKCLCKFWPFGFAFLGGVTRQSIAYCCKYSLKSVKGKDAQILYDNRGLVRPFLLSSRRPGIGADVDISWLFNNNHKRLSASYLENHPDANICLLPRYYLDRFFPAGSPERDFLKEHWQRSFCDSSGDEYIPAEIVRSRNQARELEIESALELRHERTRV